MVPLVPHMFSTVSSRSVTNTKTHQTRPGQAPRDTTRVTAAVSGILVSENPERFGPSNAVIFLFVRVSWVIYHLFQSNCFFFSFYYFFLQDYVWFVSSSIFSRYHLLSISREFGQTKLKIEGWSMFSDVYLHGYHQFSIVVFIVAEVFRRWRFRNINRDLGGQGMVDGRYWRRENHLLLIRSVLPPCTSCSEDFYKTAVLNFQHWLLLQIYSEWLHQITLSHFKIS